MFKKRDSIKKLSFSISLGASVFHFRAVWSIVLLHARVVQGQGIDINVPIPGYSSLTGGEDKDLDDDWYFWLVIGIIGAVFLTATYFTTRGFLRYQEYKRTSMLMEQNGRQKEEEGEGGRIIGRQAVSYVVSKEELDRRTNTHPIMRPHGSIIEWNAVYKDHLLRLNPRMYGEVRATGDEVPYMSSQDPVP